MAATRRFKKLFPTKLLHLFFGSKETCLLQETSCSAAAAAAAAFGFWTLSGQFSAWTLTMKPCFRNTATAMVWDHLAEINKTFPVKQHLDGSR